jgi:hypothetical protein
MPKVMEHAAHVAEMPSHRLGFIPRSIVKVRRLAGSALVAAAFAVAGTGIANATPPDATTLTTTGFTDITTLILAIAASAFALTGTIIGIVVGIRWLRKIAKQA